MNGLLLSDTVQFKALIKLLRLLQSSQKLFVFSRLTNNEGIFLPIIHYSKLKMS